MGRGLTLVAEEAAPALLAVTLPWLLAGAVETARVPNALVTVPALPAHSAPRTRAAQSGGPGHPGLPDTHHRLARHGPAAAPSPPARKQGRTLASLQHTKASKGLTSGHEGHWDRVFTDSPGGPNMPKCLRVPDVDPFSMSIPCQRICKFPYPLRHLGD